MTRGGKREGAGRKSLPEELKKVAVKFYIRTKDREAVKDFIKTLE